VVKFTFDTVCSLGFGIEYSFMEYFEAAFLVGIAEVDLDGSGENVFVASR